ncbi:DUF1236 domain-containing protein [Mesorhizobium caraganae]|jgi:ribose 5-phosphate isomerase|uniref:DUF1236 domain-containing protein n=1 Tax=Mesorhizobium caraganae TaxID=483206 RepID=A0ABV1Z543_9HYPH
MKTVLIPAVAGLAMIAGLGVAAADEVIVTQPAQQQVIITPEQRTVVHQYVKKHPLASVSLLGVELNVGSALPDTVELQEVPDVQYRYAVVDNHTVLVDPSTRRIVEVVE